MRWRGRRKSTNVEDRRSQGPARGGRMAMGGTIGIIIALVAMFLTGNVDLGAILGGGGGGMGGSGGGSGPIGSGNVRTTPEEDERAEFSAVVLADTEEVWERLFRQVGRTYQKPVLVLFKGSVRSACGIAGSAVGPFYCPGDNKLYLDLGFFDTMRKRLGAPGDFAQAYVIAHEVGHHVQNLLGSMERVHRARGRVPDREYNALQVRLELQADFYAGVFAHHAERLFGTIEEGDIEEAMRAAHAIGDDKLQRDATGTVRPETFTHGTSKQRMAWFMHGYRTGDIREGDTFDNAQFERVNARAR